MQTQPMRMRRHLGAVALGDERGQAVPEYALVMAILAAACVAAMTLLGTQIADLFTAVANAL